MDNGAHFRRCDFQVHTPRDLNWAGTRPATPEERRLFGQRFIRACRERGLDAVAITDHHDVAFFPYLKEAAENELDNAGNPVPPEQRIVVFPGMELTLGVPCQALLMLDADFPLDLLPNVATILAIETSDIDAPTQGPVARLDHIASLKELCELLDRQAYLRGHYIVLPNVSDGGYGTILRSGFAGAYREMPCIGGYVECWLEDQGTGNREILDGRNRDYGFKALGVFQTSDSRREDFRDLGRYSSWVKWAVPTAEALRQACLARRTRVAATRPAIPSVVIRSLEVSNSRFMGPINVQLNPQLNCLIGGRGTGKSTILEYLRWSLCDQPPPIEVGEEVPDFQKKRSNLIEHTLLPFEGVVTVTFLLDEVPHVVRRNSRTNQLLLKIGSSEFRECSEEDAHRLLPIQGYSQKQLSAVATRQEELHRLVRSSIERELADLKSREDELKATLRQTYGRIHAKRLVGGQVEQEALELQSLTARVRSLREQLTGLNEDDRQVIAQHEEMLRDEQLVRSLDRSLEAIRTTITTAVGDLNRLGVVAPIAEDSPNRRVLEQLRGYHASVLQTVRERLAEASAQVATDSPIITEFRTVREQWDAILAAHEAEYEAAKARASAEEGQLRQITQAEERIGILTDSVATKRERLAEYGSPEQEYGEVRTRWTAIYRQRADLVEAKCRELNQLSGGEIRATLRRGAGTSPLRDRLERLVAGTRVRTRKVDDLAERIASAVDPVAEWNRALAEFEGLAIAEPREDGSLDLPVTPLLTQVGFGLGDLERIARKLTVQEWIEISLVELDDQIIFEYRQREEDYIRFSDASSGQQATALLRVLLRQAGPPLIIDQPEEDLDNQVILDIVEEIWVAKCRRQLVFSSHNANLVVNGDADLVVVCDYRMAGDQSGGRIKATGAIDIDEIRGEITTVMEGGREAFRLRKEKYGF